LSPASTPGSGHPASTPGRARAPAGAWLAYAAKRAANALVNYAIIIFLLSLIFNTTAETTVRARVQAQLAMEASRQRGMDAAQLERWRTDRERFLVHRYHLDEPFLARVVLRAADTLLLRFGTSTIMKSSRGERDVWAIILEALPRSALVFTTAVVLEIGIAVWLGLKKAQKPGGLLDRATSIGTMVVYGMPSWWVGMILIMALAYGVPLFPSGGMHGVPPPRGLAAVADLLHHMALPVLTLAITGFWGVAYLTRNIVLGVLQEDYIAAARARGMPEHRVLFGHALRTAAPPIVTIALLSLVGSVFGNIVLEGIFSWPGMGNLYWIAVEQNDVPVILGLLAVTTGLYMLALVALDLVYGLLDPRIKAGQRA
jgi:peptide/nickel transport system permease protein